MCVQYLMFMPHMNVCVGMALGQIPTGRRLGATLVSQIVEHTEIDEHLEEIAENLIVEHVIYTISIETNNRTPGIFFHCINSQTRLTIRDTRVPFAGCMAKQSHWTTELNCLSPSETARFVRKMVSLCHSQRVQVHIQ